MALFAAIFIILPALPEIVSTAKLVVLVLVVFIVVEFKVAIFPVSKLFKLVDKVVEKSKFCNPLIYGFNAVKLIPAILVIVLTLPIIAIVSAVKLEIFSIL